MTSNKGVNNIMGRLILSGGGDSEQTLTIDKEFVSFLNTTEPLLYIPIAMDANSIPYESCFEWINSVFNPLGIEKISMWTEKDLKGKRVNDLVRFSAVYIGGGNTYSLLKDLHETGFSEVLTEYVENGGIVYGSSAGAIIFGNNIRTCSHNDRNDVGLDSFNGLDFVKEYSIWCHYNREEDHLIHNFVIQNDNPVIALPEETALIVEGDHLKVIGSKPAYIFNGSSENVILPNCTV